MEWLTGGRHPAVLITREVAIPVLSNMTLALVTSRIRGLRTEVPLGPEHGLRGECVVNCHNLMTIPKDELGRFRGRLRRGDIKRLNEALTVALGLDQPF